MARNIAEFWVIGQVGGIDAKDKVTFVNVPSNYNRQVGGEWQEDTHWNHVTCFARCAESAGKAAHQNDGR